MLLPVSELPAKQAKPVCCKNGETSVGISFISGVKVLTIRDFRIAFSAYICNVVYYLICGYTFKFTCIKIGLYAFIFSNFAFRNSI